MSLETNHNRMDPLGTSLAPVEQDWAGKEFHTLPKDPSLISSLPDPLPSSSSLAPSSSFDEDVLQTWSLGLPSEDIIRELLSVEEDQSSEPFVDPSDLLPILDHNSESNKCSSFFSEPKDMDTSQIPTILLEDDEMEVEDAPPVPRPRGRPKIPKEPPTGLKRSRGRPLGSATKNRIIPVAQSVNEAKYLRTRELNNEASRRCRLNRKQKIQVMLMEEVELREKNRLLKEQVSVKEELIDRLKSKLIALASVDVVPLIIPVQQINSV